MALEKFYETFKRERYKEKMDLAFSWFLGNNHLRQIMYNPCTGGCYDGLEDQYVNLNQGAESTVSYLMASLTLEKAKNAYEYEPIILEEYETNKVEFARLLSSGKFGT